MVKTPMKSSGILGDGDHGFGLVDARLVRLAGGGVDGQWKAGAHQHVDAVEDVRALVGQDAAAVIRIEAPVAKAIGVEAGGAARGLATAPNRAGHPAWWRRRRRDSC